LIQIFEEIIPMTNIAKLEIYSPTEYQVFQRNSKYYGQVQVSGQVRVPYDNLKLRVTGKALKGKIVSEWHCLGASENGSFLSRIEVPAGGWFKLEIRARRNGKTVAESKTEHFGVGEIFVGAGQSNSSNYGEERISPASGMVSTFSGVNWRLADDPQPGIHDGSDMGSLWPSFGDSMYKKLGVPIGVASTGQGGSSVNEWSTGSELFNWMMARIHQLGVGGFRAVVWHQGESDVEMASDEYYHKMETLINDSNVFARWVFPWFVARASYHSPENTHWDNPRAAQKALWEDGVALEGPDTDLLDGENRDGDGLGIHFSKIGCINHGKAWAKLVGKYIKKTVK
jgi:hypothetical protein